MDIKCKVTGQKLEIVTPLRHFPRSSEDFVRFLFTFTEDWDGLLTFAQFRQNDRHSEQYLAQVSIEEDGETNTYWACTLPGWPRPGLLSMLLYGTGNETVIGTTNCVLLHIDPTGLIEDAATSDMDESLYQQLVNRIIGYETQLKQAQRNYDTAADMLKDKTLSKGMSVTTDGRWQPNDGGARTYNITDAAGATLSNNKMNPLAIETETEGLYAVPVIEDMVTALDIGLERGRVRKGQLPDGAGTGYTASHAREDRWIAADNSQKLQAYLDAIPDIAVPDLPMEPVADSYGQGAHLNRIFFPAGHWFFRDPVIVRNPVAFIGVREGSQMGEGANKPTYESSHICFLPVEYVVTEGTQLEPCGRYWGDGCVVSEQTNATKRGDEHYDTLADPPVYESAYFDHALFYVASNNVVFKGLDFSTRGCGGKAFTECYHANNDSGRPHGPAADGWIPQGGKPWNAITVRRKYKGVCAIIVRDPGVDDNDRILVKGYRKSSTYVDATIKNVDKDDTTTPQFCHIEECGFTGFSGSAVIAGRLTFLYRSVFYQNYISFQAGVDNFLRHNYFGNGFCGLVTNSHAMLTSGMYIDMMAGVGVIASLKHSTFRKRTVKFVSDFVDADGIYPTGIRGQGDETSIIDNGDNEPFYFCEHEKPIVTGNLYGQFDIIIDSCKMGAYLTCYTGHGSVFTGRITNCGALYNDDTLIVKKDDFVTQEEYQKAKKFVDSFSSGSSTVYASYGTETPVRWTDGEWSGTTGNGQTITTYLNNDAAWSDNVPKLVAYLIAYLGGNEPPENYEWDTDSWVAHATGDDIQTLSAFLKIISKTSKVLLYVNWLKAGTDGIQLEASDHSYYVTTADITDDTAFVQAVTDYINAEYNAYNAENPNNQVSTWDQFFDRTGTSMDYWEGFVALRWALNPSLAKKQFRAAIYANRLQNFEKLIGTAAINIKSFKTSVFNTAVCARERRRYETGSDAWQRRWNQVPIFGYNIAYATQGEVNGFIRKYYDNTGDRNSTGIMQPVIFQNSDESFLVRAHTVPEENLTFSLYTNYTDKDNRKQLSIGFSHDGAGKLTGLIYGKIVLTEGTKTTISAAYGDPLDPSHDLRIAKYNYLYFSAKLPWYTGTYAAVRTFPLYAVSGEQYGELVGVLSFNFTLKQITVKGLANYDGEISPIVF